MGEDSAGDWTAIAVAGVRDDDSREGNGIKTGETRRTIPKERSGLAARGLEPLKNVKPPGWASGFRQGNHALNDVFHHAIGGRGAGGDAHTDRPLR
jgi:hypothetical protein